MTDNSRENLTYKCEICEREGIDTRRRFFGTARKIALFDRMMGVEPEKLFQIETCAVDYNLIKELMDKKGLSRDTAISRVREFRKDNPINTRKMMKSRKELKRLAENDRT